MVPGSALRPARPATPQDAALVRCRVTSRGLSLRLERGGGVSAGLLHFPGGNAARWRHQAQRIIEAGPRRFVRCCCAVACTKIDTQANIQLLAVTFRNTVEKHQRTLTGRYGA